ncbi:unnamed protein product [Eruca vesicaria subsp. sativa]|uniref:Cytosolic endo-beta-N-acetylglucosaminidase TIM barrel domain-containing protein n=1 Tax=Eruca vesicaria subsp. sativa TaxID=29727 RepID=A0ABC8KKQ0_ERUVS|nr:unnamed protein product [Eruca vesicaria subsp. sativa]
MKGGYVDDKTPDMRFGIGALVYEARTVIRNHDSRLVQRRVWREQRPSSSDDMENNEVVTVVRAEEEVFVPLIESRAEESSETCLEGIGLGSSGAIKLGTFITEWDEGKATCKEMPATKESAQMYAERLAELSTSLGFDGWLVPNLKEFISHLTKVLHLSTPGDLVIWYDSVTACGDLEWHDQLNEETREARAKLVSIEEKLSEEVQRLQEEVSSTLESLKRKGCRSLKQRRKWLPQRGISKKLEESAELKSLNLEKDKIQIETGQANAELEKAEQEIEETIERLQELERGCGLTVALQKQRDQLKDLEEANLLLEEAQEAESEAEKLKLTCGLKEEDEEKEEAKECFVSMELIATFRLKKLQELAESVPS